MNIAIEENRLIVTYDSDYGELIFKHGYRPSSGILYIREQPKEPLETAKIIAQIIESGLELERMLTVWERTNIRQRRY